MNDDIEIKKDVVEMLKDKKLKWEESDKNIQFNIEDVYLGEIREFKSGVSIDTYSYLFLVKGKDGLFNPFCLSDTENYAVYRPGRGVSIYVQGIPKDGPSIFVSPFAKDVRNQLGGEVISLVELQKYILCAKGFFKEREEIVRENFSDPITIQKLLEDDAVKKEKYNRFMGESAKQLGK